MNTNAWNYNMKSGVMKNFVVNLIFYGIILILGSNYCHAQTKSAPPVPEWSKHAIWYQIFPERFRDGDKNNEPTAQRIGAPKGWTISPWTGDWYQRAAWEQRVGPGFYDFVNYRRYGGDLQGVIDKLDYLKKLGVNAIYLNPVQDAVSLHKYDASYYHHVDRFFGPDPKGDAEMMKNEDSADPSKWVWTSADKLFVKLIKDGVFNHTGTDFWAFRDLVKNQQYSKFKNWYEVTSFDNPATPDTNEFDYNGWWGYKGLPVWTKKNGNIIEPVRKIIFADTRRWMDPNGDGDPSDGIDGWRLDVAEEIGHNFWDQWHVLVRKLNTNAFTSAEIWSRNAVHYINSKEFTAVMNYRFTRRVSKFFITQKYTASQLDTSLANVRADYPWADNLAMMNLMDSHDTERLSSQIVNSDHAFKEKSKGYQGYNFRAPNARERQIQKLIALFQFTYVGSPMIYYGDEAGMWGADDPDDRKPMVWPDMKYKKEVNDPLSRPRPRDSVYFHQGIFNWYQKLASIRSENEVFNTGLYKTVYTNDRNKIIAFARYDKNGNIAFVLINRGEKSKAITVSTGLLKRNTRQLRSLLDGGNVKVKKRSFVVILPKLSAKILAN
jgi:cyclomaltodextrinase